jgi:O-antigen/teichoic acid export membrane protein
MVSYLRTFPVPAPSGAEVRMPGCVPFPVLQERAIMFFPESEPEDRPSLSVRAFTGLALMLLSTAWTWGLSLIEIAIVPRFLGPANYGKMSLAGSILSFASLLVTFGGGMQIIRTISADEESANRLCSAIFWFRTLIGVPIILAIYIVMRLTIRDPMVLSLIALVSFNTYLGWMGDIVMSFRNGFTRFDTVARAGMISKFVGVCTRIGLVLRYHSPLGAVFGDTLGSVSGLLSAIFAKGERIRLHRISLPDIKKVTKAGLPYFQYNLFIWIYGNPTTIYILCALASYRENGWFSVAQRMVGIFYLLPGIVVGVMIPILTRLYEKNREEFTLQSRRVLNPAIVLSIPFALVMVLRSRAMLYALGLPMTAGARDSFSAVAILLVIPGINLPIRWLSSYYGMMLIASNRIHKQANAAIFAAIFNIGLTIPLVVWFHRHMHNGAIGAAIGAELTDLLMVIFYMVWIADIAPLKENFIALFKGLIAGVVPAVTLLYLPMHNRWEFILVCGVAIALFIPTAMLTGAIRKDEITPLLDIIKVRARMKTKQG